MVILDHHTPPEKFIAILTKSFNRQLELKSEIISKIKTTKGGEQLSWIKKYNGLFISNWKC
tara:strand:- start:906 stop:1088 length:183 start_codon:yes stop_codon:yes gene_type:complete